MERLVILYNLFLEIMALKIRLQRGGSAHNAVYRIVVAESASRRDGRFVENVGTYAPKARGKDQPCTLKLDRIDYWLSVGAKPTDTVKSLIRAERKLATAQGTAEA